MSIKRIRTKIINRIYKTIRLLMPASFRNKGFKFLKEFIRKSGSTFFTVRTWPKRSGSFGLWSDEVFNQPKFAIVIQGPLVTEDDFTLETIRIYKKIFPEAHIIVSTWEQENEDYAKNIQEEGVLVLRNDMPSNRGPGNFNLQVLSSHMGIKKAKEIGVEYVMKTRTDQRICAPNVLDFLMNLIKKFPVTPGYKQKSRIISTNIFTLKYRPYSLSDMTVFGHIDDMLIFWPLRMDERTPFVPKKGISEREYIHSGYGEVGHTAKFLENVGRELKWTIRDSWEAFADHFCVIDHGALDIYWHKVNRHKFRDNKFNCHEDIKNTQDLSFREWFNIYCNLKNKFVIREDTLDTPTGASILKE